LGYFQTREGVITGLIIGVPRDGTLHFAGVVAPGKASAGAENEKNWQRLTAVELAAAKPPIEGLGTKVRIYQLTLGGEAMWVRAGLDCEVEFSSIDGDGDMKDPVFKAW